MPKKDSPEVAIPPRAAPPVPADRRTRQSVIGSTFVIKGVVKGTEDLIVKGRIKGRVLSFSGHSVTVARGSQVKADIAAKVIRIEGIVQGDLQGEDKIFVGGTGWFRGKLVAPRVALEKGCKIRGQIEMGDDGD